MQPLTAEWVQKAEGDFATLMREVRARRAPNHDAACFHAQQCAEKYMKAVLQEASIPFPRTHNLVELMRLLGAADPGWMALQSDLQTLTLYGVAVRYPGDPADRTAAKEALRICRQRPTGLTSGRGRLASVRRMPLESHF